MELAILPSASWARTEQEIQVCNLEVAISMHQTRVCFHRHQQRMTIRRYENCRKEFMFYVILTFSLDESLSAQEYGIQFAEDLTLTP